MEKNSSIFNFSRPFILLVVLLSLTGLLSFQAASVTQEGSKQVVRCKRQWAKEDNIFKDALGRATVLFMGHSTIAAGIIPKVFDEEAGLGTYSFNLSLPALSLSPHYFMLRDFLRHNPSPKYIVMKLTTGGFNSELFPYYAVINAGFSEVLQYSSLRPGGDFLANYLLPWRFYWPEIKRYAISKGLVLMPAQIKSLVREKYIAGPALFDLRYVNVEASARERENMLKSNRGYYYIVEQAVANGVMQDAMQVNIVQKQKENLEGSSPAHQSGEEDPFVDRFFSLCAAKGIKVILIQDYTMGPEQANSAPVPESWRILRMKFQNVYFSEQGGAVRSYAPKYFSDTVHANPAGAVRFTKEIAQEFKDIVNKNGL